MKGRYIKYIIIVIVILLIIFLFHSCHNALTNDRQEIHTSPQGTNTIIIQYDIMSIPTIYKKKGLKKEKIWVYPGNGFMETVWFDLEWLSENQIRFIYDDKCDKFDEEFIITIPE